MLIAYQQQPNFSSAQPFMFFYGAFYGQHDRNKIFGKPSLFGSQSSFLPHPREKLLVVRFFYKDEV
jgi:hypothetical protein